jgi:CO/xanthine dehydrogenase FAD-binding subunit
MRGDAAAHKLIAPGNLAGVLDVLASAPGEWTPIAGGTEVMVAFSAGKLSARKLINLWGIPDLRFIDSTPETFVIGSCTTFLDLRANDELSAELPLIAKASSWIGSIANQSRATVGGNLVNGSPAADSSPALLVYDAEIELISKNGRRRIEYSEFHTGYKSNAMTVDEIVYAVHVPRRFKQHQQYLRKVGTRRAMAISKVALAGTALLKDGVMNEIRIATASLAPYPARMYETERVLAGKELTNETIKAARAALLDEAKPIDDIRSTSEYRRQVGANLLEEFLTGLARGESA